MPGFRLSSRASVDLDGITTYTIGTWGVHQADRYIGGMQRTFHLLAEHPEMGRRARVRKQNIRRIEQGSHVIFYREESGSVFVLRVVHRRMIIRARDLE